MLPTYTHKVTLDDEIKELERELALRKQLYPKWAQGPSAKMKPIEASQRIATIEATLKRLKNLKSKIESEQQSLF